MTWNFHGINERGTAQTGWTNLPPDYYVPEKFNANWQSLTVTVDGIDGRIVGSIERTADTNRRTWWAEGSLASGDLLED